MRIVDAGNKSGGHGRDEGRLCEQHKAAVAGRPATAQGATDRIGTAQADRRRPGADALASDQDGGLRLGLDRRLGSEVGRLALHGELTENEATTAFLVAEIYGRYERGEGTRRTVRRDPVPA